MANAYLNLLDVAKMNGSDEVVGLIEENLNSAPEVGILPARAIAGTQFKTIIRTALPAGEFRRANEGVETTKSSYAIKNVECFYYDGQMEVDVAVADADEQGAQHALALELDGHIKGGIQIIGKQIWYGTGTGGDADGFPGAAQIVDADMVVDAGGTTATTGSSVFAVVADQKNVCLIGGKEKIFSAGEWRRQTIHASSKSHTGYVNSLEGWIGCQWVSKYGVARIRDLTADSGKGLTDALLANLLYLFPTGVRPTHLFMSRRSRYQLQVTRTVSLQGNSGGNPKGNQGLIAPLPTEYEGIPIIATDSILNTEALS